MSELLFVKSKWITGTLLKAFKSGQINRFMMATDLVFLEKENSTTLVYDVLGSFKKSKQTLCSMKSRDRCHSAVTQFSMANIPIIVLPSTIW